MIKYLFVYALFCYNFSSSYGLKNDNNFKAYSDFLKHESGITINGNTPPATSNTQKGNGKNIHTSTTQVNGNLVAATTQSNVKNHLEFPPLPFKSNAHVDQNGQNLNNPHPQSSNQQSNTKRDYVAIPFPALPTKKPNTPSAQQGKVKDLINFYDSKDGHENNKPTFSYSSIVRGGDGNKQNPVTAPIPTSAKPSSNQHTTHRPSTGVMPSSIVNNNNKNENNNRVTDDEIRTLSEDLLKKDINNAAKYITVNYQEKTTSFSKDDKAPLPLVVVPNNVWNMPTVKYFLPLLDNYERDTLINEFVTPQERNEENAFMDAIMTTPVIRHLMSFLKDKGYVTPDPRQQRDFLKQLWFNLYSRGKGKISSSGFEHVFVSELKNGEVSGLHNWIYFAKEEAANRANYLGYLKYVTFNDKGAVLKLHFSQLGADKPVDSMFVGTSPELEMALYTLCFVTRPSKDCKLKLSGKDVGIITHPFRYRSKNYIGSAYAQI